MAGENWRDGIKYGEGEAAPRCPRVSLWSRVEGVMCERGRAGDSGETGDPGVERRRQPGGSRRNSAIIPRRFLRHPC